MFLMFLMYENNVFTSQQENLSQVGLRAAQIK